MVSLIGLILVHSGCASGSSANPSQRLIDRFWSAQTQEQQDRSGSALIAASGSVEQLYSWLRHDVHFDQNVTRGEFQTSRTGSDNLVYPYTLLVPENYDANTPMALEFNLHGGVNRARPEPGDSVWRSGNAQFTTPNRIVVLPVGWNETFWWFPNQADNLKAMLSEIKQQYNIDDNRVFMTGVSDGGTGSYFFAFKQPTEWAGFLPYIGNPGVLSNRSGRERHILFYENLKGKPLFIVNSENDPLYPARAVQKYIDRFEEEGIDYTYTVIPNGGHNTQWMPEQKPRIEQFKSQTVRDPLPDSIVWTTNEVGHYNRYHWLVIEQIRARGEPATITIDRNGNDFEITTNYVKKFSLLLNPEEVNFSKPIRVRINDEVVHDGLVPQDANTLLQWAVEDRDRSMLFTAELTLLTPQ